MTVGRWRQDPQARLDYDINWGPWLGADTITSATASVTPTGSMVIDGAVEKTTTVTKVWVKGGIPGNKYTVTVHIVTAGNREDDRSIEITVRER